MILKADWIRGTIYGHSDQINGGVVLRPKPKIRHRKPVAYISEALLVLRFPRYFCISNADLFLGFYFPIARSFGNVLISTAPLWVPGAFLSVSIRYIGELLTLPLKSNIGTESLIVLNSAWY